MNRIRHRSGPCSGAFAGGTPGLVSVDQLSQPEGVIENGSFLDARAARLWRRFVNPVGKPAQRQGLEPNLSRALKAGKEDPLAAEKRRLDSSHELDVVVHAGLEGDYASCVHAQGLARFQLQRVDRASGMDEAKTIAFQFLHDKPFSAEETHAHLLLKCDPDRDATGGAQI